MQKLKNNICFVVASDLSLKFLLLSQIKSLQNQGYDITLVCSPGKWVKSLREEGLNIKEITINRKVFTPFSDVYSLIKLFFYFRKQKFDAVFTFTPKPGLLGQMAARLAGVPLVFNTVFGFYFHENTPHIRRKFFVVIEKIAAKFSTHVFFRNKEDFDTALKENIVGPEKAELIGDGIDIVRFDAEHFAPLFLREKKGQLGIPSDMLILGIVARLVREKGYIELFEAFKMMLKEFPQTLLLVIGSTDLKKKDSISMSITKSMGIAENVIFLGERTDMEQMYALMDIFILPSHREGFSHSIMEASAMSLPVITSDIRGCRGAVDNQITGMLVPPKNTQKLAEAIRELILDSKKAKEMGKNGRKKAEHEFDERIMFSKMQLTFEKYLNANYISSKK